METEALPKLPEAEDGEIIDDPDEIYVPLERPHISSVNTNRAIAPSPPESDDENTIRESSSDSDSSIKKLNSSKIRRRGMCVKAKPTAVKKKSYNIWCSDLQTEVLTNYLVDCNVDQSNERGRDVESYNYRLKLTGNENKFKDSCSNSNDIQMHCAKRKHNGAYVEEKNRPKEVKNQKTSAQSSGNSRNILPLSTNYDNSEEEIARDIANKLCEEKEDLILRALTILGKEAVFSLFEETKEIEASGGMLIMNGTRRRTPGGVFFYLLKTSESLPREQRNLVLAEDKKSRTMEKKLAGKKMRKMQAEKFKKALAKDDFPTLLSRAELAIKEFKARRLAEDSAEVKNPPPSPATDGKDCSSDGEEQKEGGGNVGAAKCPQGRSLTSYEDNMFGTEENSMDFA